MGTASTKNQDPNPDELAKLLEDHLGVLMEYFTHVQILAAVDQPDGSSDRYSYGCGSFFGRYGQAKLWVQEVEEIDAKGGQRLPPEGEDEDED